MPPYAGSTYQRLSDGQGSIVKRLALTALFVLVLLLASSFTQNVGIGITVSKTGVTNLESLEQHRG